MIPVLFIVCSELGKKPITRAVCESRERAQARLQEIRTEDGVDADQTEYWVTEVGAEADGWRRLGMDPAK